MQQSTSKIEPWVIRFLKLVESDAIAGLRSEKPALYAKHEGREYVT
jgi:hypothetical protein